MKKALKRALAQLLDATNGLFRKPTTATRDGVQDVQQLQPLPVPARTRQ
jgi:hypothetical protein